MRRDVADNLPVVGTASSAELGARPGTDITTDPAGHVVLDGSGMSVAPRWRDLKVSRIPKRLRSKHPGAAGPNSSTCYALGAGPFQLGEAAPGLELIPDQGPPPITHGVLAPVQAIPLADYQTDLANTRAAWQEDEV